MEQSAGDPVLVHRLPRSNRAQALSVVLMLLALLSRALTPTLTVSLIKLNSVNLSNNDFKAMMDFNVGAETLQMEGA
jgi:hypothetical protein